MTKKHFEAIARALRASGAPVHVCIEVAAEIAQFNAAFDTVRFVEACGHKRKAA